ncbi:response regulator [Citrifermentans bremense]|uniref:response regulator n=1 Tax=Citrifermentans bremense TaxID=60035 RepID=UPI0004127E68|nr:response regulator [Citrifermentans bremense]
MVKKKLLVVDDTPENLIILYKILRKEYEVLGANSGKEALLALAENRPDLILLDVMMPEMDGLEVCRILKDDSRYRDIPVIFITALSDEVDESRGFEAGAVDFLSKPVNPVILSHRVAVHLELQSQKEALTRKNQELQEALSRVKELSGLLPICMTCKKIRDDQGYWNQLESYISLHSEALFSHGYCPECAAAAMKKILPVPHLR